jgi:hypothetical protein
MEQQCGQGDGAQGEHQPDPHEPPDLLVDGTQAFPQKKSAHSFLLHENGDDNL